MSVRRDDQAGFEWTEQVLGGKIVRKEKHERWRPQWFLDIELPDGSLRKVVLRGFRNPGYTASDEAGARRILAVEAEVLHVLQSVPVSVPQLYGHNEDHGWMLMERVEGTAELTEIANRDLQYSIFQDYMTEIARLHAHPLDSLEFSPLIHRPESSGQHREHLKAWLIPAYRAIERTQPEPIIELGLQWLADNEITSERPLSLGLGDIGPNQFLFVGSRYRSLIDFEFGMIADPLMEIGMMRIREMMYAIGRLPEHILHYGKQYEALTGIPFDLQALRYLTVAGGMLFNLPSIAGTNHPDPTSPDLVFLFSWEAQAQRGAVEALAEYYGLRLHAPEIPAEATSMLGPIYQTMVGQIEQHYAPKAEDAAEQGFARYSAALARTLARGGASIGRIEQDNMRELSDLLGHRVEDWYSGLYELERLIAEDYARDFEKRLNFLYRMQMRREYLYEPMQRATGCSVGQPLGRFDDLEGIGSSKVPLPTTKAPA